MERRERFTAQPLTWLLNAGAIPSSRERKDNRCRRSITRPSRWWAGSPAFSGRGDIALLLE